MNARMILATAAIVIALPLAAPAAQAVPADVNEKYSYNDFFRYRDCGLRLQEEVEGGSHFRLVEIEESDGQAWLGQDNYWFRSVLTNRDNGEWIVLSGRGLFKELSGTHISGDVWEFTAIDAGQPFVVTDSSGTVVMRDRGALKSTAIFDVFGDGEPGGELIEQEFTHIAGPHPALDQDFCEVVTSLIG